MKNATMLEVSFYYLFYLLITNILPDNIKHSIPAATGQWLTLQAFSGRHGFDYHCHPHKLSLMCSHIFKDSNS